MIVLTSTGPTRWRPVMKSYHLATLQSLVYLELSIEGQNMVKSSGLAHLWGSLWGYHRGGNQRVFFRTGFTTTLDRSPRNSCGITGVRIMATERIRRNKKPAGLCTLFPRESCPHSSDLGLPHGPRLVGTSC